MEATMRKALTTVTLGLLVSAAALAPARATAHDRDDNDYSQKDEINMNVELSADATVTVTDIAGPVEIETWEGQTAEIHVVRSARTREELEKKKIVVDHTSSSLTIQTEQHHGREWDRANVRQSVTLKLPRRVSLRVNDVAGHVDVGDIDGEAHINDVAGALHVGHITGSPTINDIAGSVTVTVGRIGDGGIRLNDIAGRLELVVDSDTNADIDVSDISGKIDVGVANVSVVGKVDPEEFHGKIGAGGPRITISDIAGSVTVRN